ncbi:hypothetical protein RM812_37975 [Streptomyces sp. DSM 40712]|uniref:Uncharacterized protein n=1 Tax=Streptomyces lancefieldiae TaxID=3075520 RepID=A0ABU3B0E2_9ACTN|nr:hypothetical protein [Streptomyces sp. DSM 40712]MDT0615919.1 hypothetical protein [Streptomyces sp. DSM 40712]
MTLPARTACAVLAGARSLLAVSEWLADAPPALLERLGTAVPAPCQGRRLRRGRLPASDRKHPQSDGHLQKPRDRSSPPDRRPQHRLRPPTGRPRPNPDPCPSRPHMIKTDDINYAEALPLGMPRMSAGRGLGEPTGPFGLLLGR